MRIRTIIVEDEPLARERLRNLLGGDPEVEVVAECGDGRSAVAAVQEHRPDLLFLDIQLPERNGFEVLADLGEFRPPAIIFVTAYDRFAVKAFEVHAIDYLMRRRAPSISRPAITGIPLTVSGPGGAARG